MIERDGVQFARQANGSVLVRAQVPGDPSKVMEATIYPDEWAKVVAHVSLMDGSKLAEGIARALHG